MDPVLIERKLESLRRCLTRIRDKCPATTQQLSEDVDVQDILAINLTRAVQMAVDLCAHLIASSEFAAPETMGQAFETLVKMGILEPELALRMKRAVGFRNIAIHNYEAIDWAIVHAIATRHVEDFERFAAAIQRHLDCP